MAEHKLFQDERTGKLVEFISKHDKEFAMVKDAAGTITYLSLEQLVPYEQGKGRLAKVKAPELHVPEEELPPAVVPIEDTRLNLNVAPAEQLQHLPGVGFATAKKIVELRMSLRVNASQTSNNLRISSWLRATD